MSQDTEEWRKIWRKTDLLFQKWQEFGEFWSEDSSLQSTEELSLMTLKSHAKFEEKLACGLENDTRNLANFHQNIWDYFVQSRKCMS